jgi:hypothetical protein
MAVFMEITVLEHREDPEDGGSRFLRNFVKFQLHYKALNPR